MAHEGQDSGALLSVMSCRETVLGFATSCLMIDNIVSWQWMQLFSNALLSELQFFFFCLSMNLQSLIFNQPDYYSPSYFPEKKRQGFIDVNNLYVTCDWFWVGL